MGGKVNTDSAFIGFALIEVAYFRVLSIRKDLWWWKDQTNYNLQDLTVVFDVDDYVAFMIFWYIEGLVKSAGFSYLACVKILAPPIIHVLGKLFNLLCVLPHLTMCKVVENSNLCLIVLLKNEIWASWFLRSSFRKLNITNFPSALLCPLPVTFSFCLFKDNHCFWLPTWFDFF